ncbi:MAG: barstar family protein [Actinobacteria bacterium]|nr:barstar family protein [Actinomycetota bacterium]
MPDQPLLASLAVTNYVAQGRLDELLTVLADAGFAIIELDGADVRDEASLLEQISAQVLDGEEVGNWDSLADVLRAHVWLLDDDRIALVWTHADRMLDGYLADLIVAADVLAGISRQLFADHRTFVTFLVGSGPNFT